MGNLVLLSSVGSWLTGVWNTINLLIDGLIYWFVAVAYRVFYMVSQANLFGDAELAVITQRIYAILGIAMLFVFAYNVLTLIANPDDLSKKDDKSLQGIAKNLIISIIMITLLPTAFNYLQRAQNNILSSNVIGNVILGGWSDSDADYSIKEAGTNTAVTILEAFYHPIVDGKPTTAKECKDLIDSGEVDSGNICNEYYVAILQAQELTRLRAVTSNNVLVEGIYDGSMEYYPLISAIAGCVAAYFFISFALDAGVRVAKLAFLQIIAPIPVALRITKPKGGTFDKWVKELSKTYISLFIRLAVVFFAMYTISLVPNLMDSLWQTGDRSVGFIVKLVATVIIILGILKFAKDAPKYAEDLFSMEHVELSIKKKLDENEYLKRGVSMVGSGIGALSSNVYQGVKSKNIGAGLLKGAGGLITGAKNGWNNGNVNSLGQVGSAINTSRAQSNATMNRASQKASDLAGDFGGTIRGDIKDAGKNISSWFTGEGISSPKLAAAKQIDGLFDSLYKNFESSYKYIDQAKDQALKDWQGGKGVKLDKDYKGYKAGQEIPHSAISESAIKDYYKEKKQFELSKKFQDEDFKNSIQSYGDTISKQLTASLGTLGADVQERIFNKNGGNIKSIKQLTEAFEKVGTKNMNPNVMSDIMALSDAIGKEVKIQSLQVQSEKSKKDDKK